jgi:serine/threonine protein kinase
VGSEAYNAPELFEEEGEWYDGVKSDIFSAGVTLFVMLYKCAPFRSANSKDPYFRRLSSSDKKAYWKIFKDFGAEIFAKDIFEVMTERDPSRRATIDELRQHNWFLEDFLSDAEMLEEFEARTRILEKIMDKKASEADCLSSPASDEPY